MDLGHLQVKMRINSLSTNISTGLEFPHMLVVTSNNSQHFIDENEIMFVKAEGSYSWIFLKMRENILVSQNLNHLQKLITNKNLVRIHRSSMINIQFAVKIKASIVTMKDNTQLKISNTYKKDLLNKFTIL